jgi:hypothetical protein
VERLELAVYINTVRDRMEQTFLSLNFHTIHKINPVQPKTLLNIKTVKYNTHTHTHTVFLEKHTHEITCY